ncbi:hypothetical protein N7481_004455 [Penicillium waksmanii]|uniref:uncharacterized protein n=1 Tax=Penicillium waksmanii TaxID=69791 RepID=UPI0025468378|nr:uncharacterized protein N7481_004455 [Penicillium waksmanii]KAJ5989245.1 hypothetical protein N7481_004455 [Penicillium waksmanii]
MRVDDKRLIAALLAAHNGIKLDYNAIAKMYGEGANYNTMEHKFRVYRKDAEVLHAEASDRLGTDAAPSAENSPEKPSGAQITTQKNIKGAKAAKSPRAKAAKGSAKKKAPGNPQDSDEEAQPQRKKARVSSKKNQKLMDVEKFDTDANSDAEATLDALMKTSGVYSELGLDMEDL